jgi:pimeloyl-ACP methyl ester carboxylesterase
MNRAILRPILLGFLAGLVALLALLPGQSNAQHISDAPASAQSAAYNSATFAQTFTHHTADVNGVQLHYVMGGSGDPVVLLHGFPQTWYEWHHVMPALAERYTVIAPDIRGLGESSKPNSGYDATTVAEDIFQLVDRLGFQRINLVGHDIAGAIVYAYAARHPDSVQRLVVLESTVPGADPPDPTGRLSHVWHPAFHQELELPEALVTGRERTYLQYFFTKYAFNKTAISAEDLNEYVRHYAAPGALSSAFAYYRAFGQAIEQNRQYAQTKLQMPVLALGGESVLGDFVLKSLQQVAVNVQGGAIPQCGHWIATERPEYLVDQLLSFFGQAT